jgi:RND family efflux transporter MFP subunit
MKNKRKYLLFFLALIGAMIAGPAASQAQEIQAVTLPSADIALSFVVSGKVAEILVKEGDAVKKGELLASLDNEPEKIQVEQLKVQATDTTRILSAKAELAQKKVDLKKIEGARAKGAASQWEVEHMRLNVRIAELALQAATIEQAQNRREYHKALRQLERMQLVSPVDGRVEKVSVETGEAVERLGPIIHLVKIDPLWIDVPVPLAQAERLTAGQSVSVSFLENPSDASANGRITHISSVADAASDTLRVRIEVPNPHGRPAGERITVGFPQLASGGMPVNKSKN